MKGFNFLRHKTLEPRDIKEEVIRMHASLVKRRIRMKREEKEEVLSGPFYAPRIIAKNYGSSSDEALLSALSPSLFPLLTKLCFPENTVKLW